MFEWSEVVTELAGFVFSFFATGAVAFRLFVADESRALKRAASVGLIGATGSLLMYAGLSMPRNAARQHTTVARAMTANPVAIVQTLCVFLLVAGLGLALSRVSFGWFLAAAAVFIAPVAPLMTGQWTRIVNPVHRLAGGLWIGTLFVMLVAGLTARMVDQFTPLALTSFTVLAISGVTTAWRHLKHLDALWTTPYGYALIAKLFVVAVVVGLGAMNWRRRGSVERSARAEVIAATIVLIITAILVSLPSPR